MLKWIKKFIRFVNGYSPSVYRPRGAKNILIISTPRSGSTWLMEMFALKRHMSYVFEPFDIRRDAVQKELGINSWEELYNTEPEEVFPTEARLGLGTRDGRPYILDLKRWRQGILSREYSFVVRRLVVKVLHGFYWDIASLRRWTNSDCVVLIRHPISVAVSRRAIPRLNQIVTSPIHLAGLNQIQKELIDSLMKSGDELEQKVLAWSLQNRVILRQSNEIKRIVTYEQLKTDAQFVMNELSADFEINYDYTLQETGRASSTANLNIADDRNRITSFDREIKFKWRDHIDADTERKLLQICFDLDIDIYSPGANSINSRYLVK